MSDSTRQSVRLMNPWVLHLQKLGLELKCPLCLNLLKRPFLLPCDHVFCNSCLPESAHCGLECVVCKTQCSYQDLRPLPFIENIVTIFRGLDAAFCLNLLSYSSGSGMVLEQCLASISTDCSDKLSKESLKAVREDNASSGRFTFLQTSNKLAQDPLSQLVESGDQKNDIVDKCSVPRDAKGCGMNVKQNANSLPLGSQIGRGGLQKCGALQIDMNEMDQFSPGSPPSLGDIKGSENDSSDQGCDDTPQYYQAAKSFKQNSDDRTRQETLDGSASESEEGHLRDLKRHKNLNYGQLDTCVNCVGHVKPIVSQTENLGTCHSQLEVKSVVPQTGAQPPAILDDSSAVKTVCGFCQSSRVSEVTGPMLHYANGKQVEEDEASMAKAIHVHRTCIAWAPQVYYVGETVKNLKAELARGAKLKCNKCGLKGAALGCYIKSCRRSYHVPCAMEITKCRWDHKGFLLLCPCHSSLRFPNEKTKLERHKSEDCPVPTQIAPQQSNFWGGSSNEAKRWVLCGSALSSEEKYLLVKFGSMIGVPVTKPWKPNVTHVIAATDANGACTRTLKVLMAILNGRWVLSIDWIKACMESMHPVDEEPYEVSLDNYGCCNGPRTGRLSALDNGPNLFNGLNFYFAGDFLLDYKEDLQDLIIAAGGTICVSEEHVMEQSNDQAAPARTLIVYNVDPPQGCKLGEEVSIIWHRLNHAQELAAKIGSQVIGHTWLLESIAAYELQPVTSC